jgi:hypothetical protein
MEMKVCLHAQRIRKENIVYMRGYAYIHFIHFVTSLFC